MHGSAAHGSASADETRIFRALTELAPDFVGLLDPDGAIKYLSPAVRKVTGFRPSEMLGKPFGEFVHPDDQAHAQSVFEGLAKADDTAMLAVRVRHRGGRWVSLEIFARAYFHEGVLEGILMSTRDVTRHVELIGAIRKSAQAIADLFENAPCGYHSVDTNGTVLRINNTELKWLQRERGEVVGKMRFADLLVPASQEAYLEGFAALKKEGAVSNVECDVLRRDGSTFSALWHATAVFEGEHVFKESRSVLYDITDRKLAQAELLKINRALRVLNACRVAIIHARNETGLFESVCQALVRAGAYRMACVHMVEHDQRHTMRPVAMAGAGEKYIKVADITWADTESGRGPIGTAARTGVPQVNQNFATNPKVARWRDIAAECGYGASISLPLSDGQAQRAGSRAFATLTVYAAEADAFNFEEYELLRELSEDVSFGAQSLRAGREDAGMSEPPRTARPEDEAALARLSGRERQVLIRVVEGRTSKEIARELGVSPASVDTYRSRILFKLGVDDLPGLVRFAIRQNLIAP